MPVQLSVVIPTYNNPDRLPLVLRSLAQQAVEEDWEVVVVDDGSTTDTEACVAPFRELLPLRLVRQENRGRAGARNRGLREAGGRWVCLLDDDVVLAPGALRAHLAARREGSLSFGRIRNTRAASFPAIRQALAREGGWAGLDAHVVPDGYVDLAERLYRLQRVHIPWAVCTGANLMVERDACLAAGGFDEGFRGWGPEDIEFAYRLHRAGIAFRYLPGAVVHHLDRPKRRDAMLAEMMAGVRYLAAKYPGIPEIRAYLDFITGRCSLEELNARTGGERFSGAGEEATWFQPLAYLARKTEEVRA
ncbi:glycosyltransferase involved in cell wall biosynthesis [Symbiobacterium terraclitae]|uniref:Glycosyltransferase involved in cell wall biosynthesis n=1 Tax=Symbiobacterium terraclitae TaxID=557451 RepID=A0ABS4JTS5_9FIRM|nr:glycosyltransferase [Symbiobacterium terraclitae]MBP2018925.1 glycosyltransferase involved in cell wall biosynthesis [Symbiobacterium terraclitae]